VSVDLAFGPVIDACAAARAATGTWITPEMRAAYLRLHELGHAHAVETWSGAELVGGLYGIAIGDAFFGESMFSHATDASKVALVRLVRLAESRGIRLIDCQLATRHLASLGSQLMPREEFLSLVRALTAGTGSRETWRAARGPTAPLAPSGTTPSPLHG
jgi:leucyl/phenylalanyl-tRNA--protein transferase